MTSMNANNQDFNWIDACLRCSIEHEFESLKKCLMTSVDTMQSYVEQKGHLVDRPPIVVPPTVLVQRPPEAWGEGR